MKQEKTIVVCVLALGVWAAQARAQAVITHLSENFDSTAVGSVPAGWAANAFPSSGYTYVTNDLFESGPNSLSMTTTNTAYNFSYAVGYLSPYIPTNTDRKVTISFSMNLERTDVLQRLLVNDLADVPSLIFDFNNLDQIWANGTVLGSYSPGIWYDVQVQSVPRTHTYNVSVSTNGALYASATNLAYWSSAVSLSYLEFVNYGNGLDTVVAHVDNVLVTSIPEPSSLGLAGAGMLALLAATRGRFTGRS